jgi:hypothetical protein
VEAGHEIVNIDQGAGQLRRPRQTRCFGSPGRSGQALRHALNIAALSRGWRDTHQSLPSGTSPELLRRPNTLAAERTVSLQTAVLCSKTRLGVHALVVASYSSAVISDSASAGSDS